MLRFQQRLKHIKARLKQWNKEEFRNIHQEKKNLERKMAYIQQEIILNSRIDNLAEDENPTQLQLDEQYAQEEILCRKKSRIQWLKEGEKNTTFFHITMIQHRHNNKIFKLHNNQGETIHTKQQI